MEFELIILKNILNDKSYFNKVKGILSKSIFTDISCAKVYELIQNYYNSYNTIPTFKEIAIQTKDIPNKELRTNIAKTLIQIKDIENINSEFLNDHTVKYVKDQMFMQALMLGAEFIDKKDEHFKQQAKKLIDDAQLINIDNDFGSDYNNINERIDYYQNPKKGIKFLRFKTLNRYIGEGFLKGTLNMFLAPAGVGKSLLMSTCIGDFIKQGLNVLLVSMEMSNLEFMKRIDADLLDIQINTLKEVEPNLIRKKFNDLKLGKLFVQNYPAGTFSANNLASLLEMYNSNDIKFDAIFLDYLGLMKSDRISSNIGLYSYIKSIGEEVRAIANIYDTVIFSASQLNRNSINNTLADNSSISDSLGTAMTADWMCFLLQTDEMKSKNIIKFKITKNRYNGLTQSFDMNINYNNMRIEETQENTANDINYSEINRISNDDLKKINSQKITDIVEWSFD